MKTLGEARVRVDFNVKGDPQIDFFKKKSAELIDACHSLKDHGSIGNQEKNRLASLAQTKYEEAAMWAVKAITFKD